MTLTHASVPRRSASDSPGEFTFDREDFKRIAAMMHAECGLFLAEEKMPLVYGRLVKRLRVLGLSSFRDYCRLVDGVDGIDERQCMLAALTTHVTAFFRERHHFDHLKSAVLPALAKKAREGKRVRIWSAGCSKGHEPFSIAITVLAAMPDAAGFDVKILATDIDPFCIAYGREGLYPREELVEVPKDAMRHFKPSAGAPTDSLKAASSLTDLVTFNELNLTGPWPMKGRFDVIFCRNVTIYFDPQTQAAVWNRYASLLQPGGHLYIGHSERLSDDVQGRFTPVGTTMYRLKDGAAA